MFPNVRLLIVAVLASVVALSCGSLCLPHSASTTNHWRGLPMAARRCNSPPRQSRYRRVMGSAVDPFGNRSSAELPAAERRRVSTAARRATAALQTTASNRERASTRRPHLNRRRRAETTGSARAPGSDRGPAARSAAPGTPPAAERTVAVRRSTSDAYRRRAGRPRSSGPTASRGQRQSTPSPKTATPATPAASGAGRQGADRTGPGDKRKWSHRGNAHPPADRNRPVRGATKPPSQAAQHPREARAPHNPTADHGGSLALRITHPAELRRNDGARAARGAYRSNSAWSRFPSSICRR